jgi:isocitrate/isopropylmalate dehydrogenase
MAELKKVTIARGDGIGHEIMDATLKILHKPLALQVLAG